MNVLEKILEEIEQRKARAEKLIVKPPHDKLDQVANDTAEAFIEAYKECQDIIRKHMNDRWISVEDRLPEDDRMVLVTCQTKKGIRSVNRAYCDGAFWHGSGSMSGVIAWRPLPEPYRPERI